MPQQFLDCQQINSRRHQPRGKRVAQIMKAQGWDLTLLKGRQKSSFNASERFPCLRIGENVNTGIIALKMLQDSKGRFVHRNLAAAAAL